MPGLGTWRIDEPDEVFQSNLDFTPYGQGAGGHGFVVEFTEHGLGHLYSANFGMVYGPLHQQTAWSSWLHTELANIPAGFDSMPANLAVYDAYLFELGAVKTITVKP